jgi:hypothetical protein
VDAVDLDGGRGELSGASSPEQNSSSDHQVTLLIGGARVTDNPILVRELRRMRLWERRCSPAMALGLPMALGGLALPLVAASGLCPVGELWRLGVRGMLACYAGVTPLLALAVLWDHQQTSRARMTEQLRVTLLTRRDIEFAKLWGFVLPPLACAAVGLLGVASLSWFPLPTDAPAPLRETKLWVPLGVHCFGLLVFIAFAGHFHLTVIMARGALSETPIDTLWGLIQAVFTSVMMDVMLIGLVIKLAILMDGLGLDAPRRSRRRRTALVFSRQIREH